MSLIEHDQDLGQLEWEMAVSATQIGRVLRILGLVISYVTALVVLVLCFYFFFAHEWRIASFYSVISLLSGIPTLAIGQIVALHGTQAILRGIVAQNLIVDRDISENFHID
jgi:hypothetical protein